MPEQNFAERLALESVIYPVIGVSKSTLVHSNYELSLVDGSKRYIDFAIIGSSTRIAIEIDGYRYHAEGVIDRPAFDDQLIRQNEILIEGWKLLRFSFDQIKSQPQVCQDQLRRYLISDAELHPNFRNTFEPSQLQIEVLAALQESRKKGKKKGLVCLPTGTGKTILSALDAKALGGRILFIVHNNHILEQAKNAYKKIFPDCTTGFINSEYSNKAFNEDVIFANIGSLRNISDLEKFAKDAFSYLVIDEFHHGAASSYKNLLDYFTPNFTLGLTATPERTDGKSIRSLLQNNLIYSISLNEAIGRGFLVPFSYYGLYDNIDYTDIKHNGYRYDLYDLEKALHIPRRNEAIFKEYQEHGSDKLTIAFCVSIEHSEKMAAFFNSKGISSIAIHSKLSKHEKAKRIALFEKKEVQIVCVRDLFNEGVDFPDTQVVLFLRPTESKIIFLQQLGRGLRLSANKSNIIVLDFIGNYLGAQDIPALIRKSAGDNETLRPPKPEYEYDNGCEIRFSKEIIEHLHASDFKVLGKENIVKKVFRAFENKRETLNPLDLYLEFKEEFGSAIRSYGGFGRLCERMNSLDRDVRVIDSEFTNFDPENHIDSEDYESFIINHGIFIAQKLQQIINKVELGLYVNRQDAAEVKKIRQFIFELFEPLSSLCLIRNIVNSYAYENIEDFPKPITPINTKESLFFSSLSKMTSSRNAVAISNVLLNEFDDFRISASIALENNSDPMYINFVNWMLEYQRLSWLRDFYTLTNPDKLNY